ncbi:MAG TPA: DeoR/GlpR family DNA-binding transcription regulator [Gaiellaceae bacterium]|jgi:DeoR/GlpR family transcriptional regulator of sugar metabolism|nr:DeoR/GlpR family DNA-binding transcription regulator [Gaiellaceae bacterium]
MQMLTAERRHEILVRLARDDRVVVSELVASLGVSEDTVRRDLRELAEKGLVHRVHGGALVPASPTASFVRRLELSRDVKAGLAEAALPLLERAQVIVLDGGTTNLELASRLPPTFGGTVVTNSPPTASVLANHPNAEVLLIGGKLLKEAQVTVGPSAVEAFRAIRADLCVLGGCAFQPEIGVMTTDADEAPVKRAMIECSGQVVALATADKLALTSPWVVAALQELDYLVTDAAAEATRPYAAAGIDVVSV